MPASTLILAQLGAAYDPLLARARAGYGATRGALTPAGKGRVIDR